MSLGSRGPKMYEDRRSPPLSRAMFFRRLGRHFGLAALVLGASLVGGVLGYRYFEGLAWRESFLHSALLLAGMGLVQLPHTPSGTVFVGLYALYAGLVFLVVTGMVFAPVVHRMLHRFHWDGDRKP